jgi:hypothetical protein
MGQGGLRLGLLDAPVANGQMGHLLDFDDTHMGGVVLHTSSPLSPRCCRGGHRPSRGASSSPPMWAGSRRACAQARARLATMTAAGT